MTARRTACRAVAVFVVVRHQFIELGMWFFPVNWSNVIRLPTRISVVDTIVQDGVRCAVNEEMAWVIAQAIEMHGGRTPSSPASPQGLVPA